MSDDEQLPVDETTKNTVHLCAAAAVQCIYDQQFALGEYIVGTRVLGCGGINVTSVVDVQSQGFTPDFQIQRNFEDALIGSRATTLFIVYKRLRPNSSIFDVHADVLYYSS
jgi:hypothetical protein